MMFAKGILCLVVFWKILAVILVSLLGINTEGSDYKSTPYTNASLIHHPPTDGDKTFDDNFLPDTPKSSWFSGPVLYGITGGAIVLGIILTTYACYSCCVRRRCYQQATAGGTRNLPRMVQFLSQFPISPSYIYKDDGVACLVNQE